MKIVIQRVSSASVSVAGEAAAQIGVGILLLVGFGRADDGSQLAPMATKVANLRIFDDRDGRFAHSILDAGGAVLVVPNFTLYGDSSRGRRPDFTAALEPDAARRLFDGFINQLVASGIETVKQGIFGAHMHVELVNDGPVTLLLETSE